MISRTNIALKELRQKGGSMKKIMLTCKDPGQFFRDCPACKHYEKCDYFNKIKKRKKEAKVTECNHDYEFKASQFKYPKWVNFYTCRKCGKRLKVHDTHKGGEQL